jgi:Putative Flp pilus-assembly TadE/G-like
MKHPSESERGQAIVILALMMIGLLAFAALAIDGGNAYVERRRSQNGADAAALAGARQIWMQQSAIPPDPGYETPLLIVINQAAESNGIALGPNGDNYPNPNVVAYYTDKDGNVINTNQVGTLGFIPPSVGGIQVQASRQFSTFVGGFFSGQSPAASARATAVIIKPNPCGSWAIYASGTNSCSPADVKISGGGQVITITNGGVYSNGSLNCNTSKATVGPPPPPPPGYYWEYNGSLEYDALGNKCVDGVNGNIVKQGAVAPPAVWNFDDFKPGGLVATELSISGTYHSSIGTLSSFAYGDGLYYVDGDVSIGPNTVQRVTVVATGQIQGSGSSDLRAYYDDLLFFSNLGGTPVPNAVKLSGSNVVWQGLIYAPNGSVDMSAASNLTMGGSINALCANLSGAGMKITYDPASCVPQRVTEKLLK